MLLYDNKFSMVVLRSHFESWAFGGRGATPIHYHVSAALTGLIFVFILFCAVSQVASGVMIGGDDGGSVIRTSRGIGAKGVASIFGSGFTAENAENAEINPESGFTKPARTPVGCNWSYGFNRNRLPTGVTAGRDRHYLRHTTYHIRHTTQGDEMRRVKKRKAPVWRVRELAEYYAWAEAVIESWGDRTDHPAVIAYKHSNGYSRRRHLIDALPAVVADEVLTAEIAEKGRARQ